MTELEFIENCKKCKIDEKTISKIESVYGISIPENIKGYFSYVPDDYFCGEWRVLSTTEILDSKKLMLQDYPKNKIIPLIDAGDLDYISYIGSENQWAKVHDGDGLIFRRKKNLADYIN